MLLITILAAIVINNHCADAEISVSECVADWLVINRELRYWQDEDGRFVLEFWSDFLIFDNENDQEEDRRNFDELVAKCVGEGRVEMSEDGQRRRRMVNLWRIIHENGVYYDVPLYVSWQLGYVLHNIQCVDNYAILHYENAKTEMINPDQIRVIADTLPDIVHSGMDGFGELKECIEKMEQPDDSDKSLIGNIPSLFGYKSENEKADDECLLINVDDQEKDNSGKTINCINVLKLKQSSQIKRILQKYVIPTGKVNDQIAAEMHCTGDFLVTKMMAKTRMELFEKDGDRIVMRSIVKPKEPMGQDAEQLYQEHCSESVVRRNAMRKHGLGGMLNASYGTMYLDRDLQHILDKISMHLADSLADKFVPSGVVEIVRLTARSDVLIATDIMTSLFRIRIHHEKVNLNYQISKNTESDLYNYIKSIKDVKFKNWEQKTLTELVQLFDSNQLFLSQQFMNNFLNNNKGQESILYSNMTCIADFMIIYEGQAAKFGENGKIVPDDYSDLVRKDRIGEEQFAQLAKCFGEDWVEMDNHRGVELLNVHEYLSEWGMDKYQVSEELERLLVNLRCVADYLVLNDGNVRIKRFPPNNLKIDEKTMPQCVHRMAYNSDEFDKMVECMKEPNGNYQIFGQIMPSLIRHEYGRNGDGIRIQLKEPNNPITEKLLAHAYINEEIVEIIRSKFRCIVGELVEQGKARTSLTRDPVLHGKTVRKMAIRNLPENLLEGTGCDQIFRNEDDQQKWKLEQRLNRNNFYYLMAEEMMITDEQLLQKLNQQSLCLADCLSTHFWPKYVEEITDNDHLEYLAHASGGINFRFKLPNDLEFRRKLDQFLHNTETAEEFTKCMPKLAKTPEDHLKDILMDYLNLFDPDQLFLSKEFDLFGRLADWLVSKFGPKYIAKIVSIEDEQDWPRTSNYKFQFEKTEEFYAELKRNLYNVKNNQEFKKLAKCFPEINLYKDKIMADASEEFLYNLVKDHLENLDPKYLYLSNKFDLVGSLPDYHLPAKGEIDSENFCLICHDEFGSENGVKQLPNCKHFYHAKCIKSWLEIHNRCPYCSATIFS